MGADSLVLTAQNGLGNEECLAQLFGPKRVAGGLAFLCANRSEDGTIEHLDYGHIHIGNFQRGPDQRLHRLSEMFNRSGIECKVVESLALSRWKKLIWNVPFNGLSTLTDQTVDKIVANPTLRKRAFGLMKELQAVASAYDLIIEDAFVDLMMDYTDKMKPYFTSMYLDAQAGRAVEIEPIFGQPIRYAQLKGMATPLLNQLYDDLKKRFPKNL